MVGSSVVEFFRLLGLRIVVATRNIVEFARVITRFYRQPNFRKWDLTLLWSYAGRNPFKISRRYLESKGASDPHLYGETPLTSLELVAQKCGWKSSDCLYELGCGRGRTCLWLKAFIGCRVVGIEQVPEFVAHAQRIKDHYSIPGLEFRQADMSQVDYSEATAIYLYGTCLEETFIQDLLKAFVKLPKGAKVATVSYQLNDYSQQDLFVLVKKFPVRYPWGTTEVYLQEKL